MSPIAIRAEGLSKLYRIPVGSQRHDTLRDLLSEGFRSLWKQNGDGNGQDTVWALRGVSFDVQQGEVLGIIGQNGAGKSTLLKILSRITQPTQGRAEIRGRIGSMLEVGTGFHPELTGRENVYLNGAILGMRKQEIDRNFDAIVAFAEIDRFMDTPVKRYSTGMSVRLAFAVAAHLQPEILLIDEVLAVGDVAFQRKCLGQMSTAAREGRTVLFVSHNMVAIQNLCTRAIVLRQGGIAFDGTPGEAVRDYLSYLTTTSVSAFADNPERKGNGQLRVTSAAIVDETGQVSRSLVAGKPATFVFTYENPHAVRKPVWGMSVFNHTGVAVADFDIRYTNFATSPLEERGKFICHIPSLPLPIGEYRAMIWVSVAAQLADLIPNALVFDVESSVFYDSPRSPAAGKAAVLIQHEWRHEAG